MVHISAENYATLATLAEHVVDLSKPPIVQVKCFTVRVWEVERGNIDFITLGSYMIFRPNVILCHEYSEGGGPTSGGILKF